MDRHVQPYSDMFNPILKGGQAVSFLGILLRFDTCSWDKTDCRDVNASDLVYYVIESV